MDILISVTAKIAEYTVQPLGRQLGYVFFFHANFQKLNTQVEMLKDTKVSVQDKTLTATRNVQVIKPAVEKWLKKVDDFIAKSEGILAHEGEHGRLCSTNLVQRHKLSRKARKMADEALEMKNEGHNFDTTSYEVGISLVESSLPKVPDFLDFDSRKSTVKQIMDALSDDNVHRIGVFGMGGVGKTMLVKEILRKITKNKSFDEVVNSTVSQPPDVKSIQAQLADKLKLDFKQLETTEGRALRLHTRLKMEKSILVVLDDIWEHIDLETIGIPSVEDHTGCKVLLTSRNKHLISNEMGVDKSFDIKVLENDESWNLFKAVAGEIDETVEPIAIQIVRECAGLPIAITTVAKALRNKLPPIWNDALNQLKRDDVVTRNIRGMDKKVYSSLKLSYDHLECEEAKLLFLLCSMFPEDFNIDVEQLHEYAMAMGFLHGVDTVAQVRNRIETLVDILISSSLLILQYELRNNYVKMHDLVRDVAISISYENVHISTLSYVKRRNEEWKEEDRLSGNYTAVSLVIQGDNNLHLPKLMLPKVQLFMLSGLKFSLPVRVVETFFGEMKEIKGLVLEHVNISMLQRPSIYSLTNIRVLRLHGCELGSIDMIGELKKLEILDLSWSDIIQIPTTMSQLTQLRVLNLSDCDKLKVIPPNILSKLTKLEELSVETFDRWEGEKGYEGRENASLFELQYLSRLYTLNLTIQEQEVMSKPLFSKELNLEKFDITIGCKRDRCFVPKNIRTLDLEMESGSWLDDWIKTLLKKAVSVRLRGSICAMALQCLEVLDGNDISHLKCLYLHKSLELQHFIDEKSKHLRKCASKLEVLELHSWENLVSVIHGFGEESTFNKLRILMVLFCSKLETVFFNCMLDDVLNLEDISVSYSEKMKVMFIVKENEEGTNHIIEFTNLYSIYLHGLPRLQIFCSKSEKFVQLSIQNPEESTICNSFFSEEVSLPNLERLEIHYADNLKMIWSNNVPIPNSFSKLKKMEIHSCDNLHNVLFPPNVFSFLTCLKILTIKHCELLEGIFEVQEPTSVVEATPIVLPNLTHFELCNLPNLEYVWSKNQIFYGLVTFENIKRLLIEKCSKLKGEYLWSIKTFKQLKRLTISIRQLTEALEMEKSADRDMLESKQLETSSSKEVEVIQLENGSELFPKLKRLKLYGFVENNSAHLPMEIVQILNQLEEFNLKKAFIEEIFPRNILIPRSRVSGSWSLHKLPKLRHLWSEECSQNNNDSILQDLNFLSISECGGLSSLVSSSVCFTNLTFLEVKKCDRLTHLLSPSVATTLVQLKRLRIKECKRMSSIIEGGSVDEEGNDESIIFNNLHELSIYSCLSLTRFSCGRCIIKFPCLKYAHIRKCPEMKVFSLGIVSTPHLKFERVYLYNDDDDDTWYHPKKSKEMLVEVDMNVIMREYWEDNIDTRIPNLFGEESLEENQSENSSSSSNNNVEK